MRGEGGRERGCKRRELGDGIGKSLGIYWQRGRRERADWQRCKCAYGMHAKKQNLPDKEMVEHNVYMLLGDIVFVLVQSFQHSKLELNAKPN